MGNFFTAAAGPVVCAAADTTDTSAASEPIELPADILGLLISKLTLKPAVRVILSSKGLFEHDGWARLERIELKKCGGKSAACKTHSSVAVLLEKPSLLAGVKNVKVKSDFCESKDCQPTQLLHSLAPQIEECTIIEVSKFDSFFESLDPTRVRVLRLVDPYSSSSSAYKFLTKFKWPNLEELWIGISFLKSLTDIGCLGKKLRKCHILEDWPSMRNLSELWGIVSRLITSIPQLEQISYHEHADHENALLSVVLQHTYSYKLFKEEWDNAPFTPQQREKLLSIVRVDGISLCLLLEDPTAAELSELYQKFYSAKPLSELYGLFDILEFDLPSRLDAVPTKSCLKWLDKALLRTLLDYSWAVSSVRLSRCMIAFCALLYHYPCTRQREPFWRERLLRELGPDVKQEYYQQYGILAKGCFWDTSMRSWIEMMLTEYPESTFCRSLVQFDPKLRGLSGCDLDNASNYEVEWMMASRPDFPAHSIPWFLRVTEHFFLTHSTLPYTLDLLKLADRKGWRATSDESVRLWECEISRDLFKSYNAVESFRLYFRIYPNAHEEIINFALTAACYSKWGNFDFFAELVQEHRVSFAEKYPESVEKMQERFEDTLWDFVLRNSDDSTVESDAALAAVMAVVEPRDRHLKMVKLTEDELKSQKKYDRTMIKNLRAMQKAWESRGYL